MQNENKINYLFKYITLESVGSAIDDKGIVYPMLENGDIDIDNGITWIHTSDEWDDSLSEEDCGLLNDWLVKINYSAYNYKPQYDVNYDADDFLY
ncbi:MAG: hypothetical protein Unbinned2990contig1001_45 [Prokaryotic dsDNA virus sp.]|nr:MAG: hypothetical protein Unbinned2990contig1001_45 [Prokaryotic dsDNA virus sp.]|tara:strand:+ start:25424 stop:25708 length:285 start_codon:yes stop_codon:yes gene_type:complete